MSSGSLGTALLQIAANTANSNAALEKLNKQVKKLQTTINNVNGNKAAKNVEASAKKMEASLEQVGAQLTSIGASFARLGISAVVAGAAIGKVFQSIIKEGAAFEKQMSAVQAVLSPGGKTSFDDLAVKAKELGATTQFTAAEVGSAMEFLAIAGLNADEVISSVNSTLNLAAASSLSLGEAADVVTDLATAFKLLKTETDRVSDALTKTAANANTTVKQLVEGFKFVSSVASSTGQSIEDISVAMGVLANSGVKASVAGTGLSQVLSKLASSSKKADAILKRYGSSFAKVNPEVVSIIDIMKEFRRINLSVADAMALFDVRAGRTALALKNIAGPALDEFVDKLNNSFGEAIRQRLIRMDNFIGKLKELESIFSTFKIEIFESFEGPLKSMVEQITEIVRIATEWVKQNKELVNNLSEVALQISLLLLSAGGVSVAIGLVIAGTGSLITAFVAATAVAAFFGTTLVGLLGTLGVIGAAFTLLTLAIIIPLSVLVINSWQKIKEVGLAVFQATLVPLIDSFNQAFTVFGTISEKTSDSISDAFDGLLDVFSFVARMSEILFRMLGNLLGIIPGVIVGLNNLAQAWLGVGNAAKAVVPILLGIAGWFIAGPWGAAIGLALGFATAFDKTKDSIVKAQREQVRFIRGTNAYIRNTKEIRDGLVEQAGQTQKIVGLLSRFSELNILELKQLRDLRKGRGDLHAETIKNLARLRQEEESLQGKLPGVDFEDLGTGEKINVNEIKLQLEQVRQGIRAQEKNLEILNKLLKEHPELLKMTEAEQDAIIEKEIKYLETVKNAETATKDVTSATKELDSILKSLVQAGMGKLEKDMTTLAAQMEKAKNEQIKLNAATKASLELAKLEVTRQREKVQGIRDEIDELKRKGDVEGVKKRREVLLEEEELLQKNLDRAAELTKAEKQRSGRLAEIQKEGAKRQKAMLEEASKKRDAALLSDQIKTAKAEGDKVKVAQLKGQELIRQREEQKNKIFEIVDEMTAKEKAQVEEQKKIFEASTQAQVKSLVETAKLEVAKQKQKEATKAQSKFLNKIENEAAKNLAKQVNSVQQLLMLHKALARLRARNEALLLEAAKKAAEAERRVLKIKQQLAATSESDPEKKFALQQALETALILETASKNIANASAAQKGVAPIFETNLKGPAGEASGAPGTNVGLGAMFSIPPEKLNAAVQQVENFVARLRHILIVDGEAAWHRATDWWISRLESFWNNALNLSIDKAQELMEKIKQAMSPDQKASPSFSDVWQMNADTVEKGLQQMSKSIASNPISLAAIANGVAPNRGADMTGVKGAPRVNNLHDNRSVTMDINSKFDVDNTRRIIGRALADSGMDASSI